MSEERERHIAGRHPDILQPLRKRLAEVLAAPDVVRRSRRLARARLFSRWYTDLQGRKSVVVVVVSEPAGDRHWVITAYVTGKQAWGVIEWTRN
jgi:hypothetical protein